MEFGIVWNDSMVVFETDHQSIQFFYIVPLHNNNQLKNLHIVK